MRETFHLAGKKVYIEASLEQMLVKVRETYPEAIAEGSMNHYSFLVSDGAGEQIIIAEAWSHRDRPGWWLRIKSKVAE